MFANIAKKLSIPGARPSMHDLPQMSNHGVIGPPRRQKPFGAKNQFPQSARVKQFGNMEGQVKPGLFGVGR